MYRLLLFVLLSADLFVLLVRIHKVRLLLGRSALKAVLCSNHQKGEERCRARTYKSPQLKVDKNGHAGGDAQAGENTKKDGQNFHREKKPRIKSY